jgi:hypothetical protein
MEKGIMYKKVALHHSGWRNRAFPQMNPPMSTRREYERRFAYRFFSIFLLFSFYFLSLFFFPFFLFPVFSLFCPSASNFLGV